MASLWLRQLRTKNATAVDVAWALNLAGLAVLCAAFADGAPWRRAAVALAAGFHGLRLGLHLYRDRIAGRREEEDGRYAALRARWGEAADRRFFVFYQAQALLDVLLAAPFLLAALRVESAFGFVDALAAALWLSGFLIETSADAQLRRFRADPASRGAVCRVGWWSVSRHPNYFGEWLMWTAYAVVAWPAPWGPFGVVAPAIMLFSILKVTGIPPTEAQALRSRGDAYRRYQREVSAFFPWFPRRSSP
jgi:steroid 5-alpha reductase family enzyme